MHLAYHRFLSTRGPAPGVRDVRIASLIYIGMMISFIWMPFVLALHPAEPLRLIGFALFTAAAVFLARRADRPLLLTWGLILVVIFPAGFAFLWHFLGYDSVLHQIGGVFVTLALGTYMITTILAARQMRIKASETVQRNVQEQKMVAIGELVGGVAHDFNNVLTAIIGNLELHDVMDDPAEKRVVLQEAYDASKRAEAVVKQLLIYSRKAPSAQSDLDLDREMTRMLGLAQRLISETIELRYVPADRALVVRADETMLMTALINLILNAAEAMPQGGCAKLSVCYWAKSPLGPMADGALLNPGSYAAITLQDEGHGIAPEMLNKVIQPFVSEKKTGQGTGLGLPMVLGFAKEAGGGLQIESSHRGTLVSIWLPVVHIAKEGA
ncbi:MAG: ATP-binding protein [Pelagimonas sp.]|jgi:signal transduction histidine kinase|nr:ATP-binding protein [Pelagimonas sp.]